MTLQPAAAQRVGRRTAELFDLRLAVQMFKVLDCHARNRSESENVSSYDFLFQFPV